MRTLVKCLSEGGIFQDGWGSLFVILGKYEKNECYIIERGVVIKQLLSQEKLMEEIPYCGQTYIDEDYH